MLHYMISQNGYATESVRTILRHVHWLTCPKDVHYIRYIPLCKSFRCLLMHTCIFLWCMHGLIATKSIYRAYDIGAVKRILCTH